MADPPSSLSITVEQIDAGWRAECTCGWRDEPWPSKHDAIYFGSIHARSDHPGQFVVQMSPRG